MAKRKVISISLSPEEEQTLKEIGDFLGLTSQSAIAKACLPWALQRLNIFLKHFEDVIQPLKTSEIDSLITTMKIRAKVKKDGENRLNPLEM